MQISPARVPGFSNLKPRKYLFITYQFINEENRAKTLSTLTTKGVANAFKRLIKASDRMRLLSLKNMCYDNGNKHLAVINESHYSDTHNYDL